jgi:hypothetical protein
MLSDTHKVGFSPTSLRFIAFLMGNLSLNGPEPLHFFVTLAI